VLVSGNPAGARGVNIEGLKRRGYTRAQIDAVRAAYKTIYRNGLTLEEAKAALAQDMAATPDGASEIGAMLAFLDTASRGIVR
jgi:UDP-N-acetylglucosamine acyltransferase